MGNRIFEARKAVRERTPLIVEIVGPSGTGKTKSALRLADGINRIEKGKTFLIDTEARRALHHAEAHDFVHVPFGAPFSPLDYLEAFQFCAENGATTIIVDSMSHEHEGPGGVLEWHEQEMGGNQKKNMLAWAKPKAARRRMINTMLQMPVSFILCFRAKEKLDVAPGKEPVRLGWMPIGADELIYEATVSCLLPPGANGVPLWNPTLGGEKSVVKLPGQFRGIFADGPQLSEDIGEALARWAAGTATTPQTSVDEIVARLNACSDAATMRAIEDSVRASWKTIDKPGRERITKAVGVAKERMARAERFVDNDEYDSAAPDADEQREMVEADRKAANS